MLVVYRVYIGRNKYSSSAGKIFTICIDLYLPQFLYCLRNWSQRGDSHPSLESVLKHSIPLVFSTQSLLRLALQTPRRQVFHLFRTLPLFCQPHKTSSNARFECANILKCKTIHKHQFERWTWQPTLQPSLWICITKRLRMWLRIESGRYIKELNKGGDVNLNSGTILSDKTRNIAHGEGKCSPMVIAVCNLTR